jgi:hypothetical protein
MNIRYKAIRELCVMAASCVLFQISLSVVACWAAELPDSGQKGNVGFWIGTNTNEILDDALVNSIANRAGIVVLNSFPKGDEALYDYPSIVKRFHKAKPGLPVLGYTWATKKHEGKRIGGSILEGYEEVALRTRRGKPLKVGDVLYGDVRNPKYHEWLSRTVVNFVTKSGLDGMLFDEVIRTPSIRPKPLASMCQENPGFCKEYGVGLNSLFEKVQRALSPKLMIYNGLANLEKGMLKDQEELLRYADGATIEHFGMTPRDAVGSGPSFSDQILPFLQIMQSHPSKTFLVFGRGPWDYVDYRQDYLWQRYLFCSYLLGAGAKTFFKYHSSFQVPAHEGRSGGVDLYADWDIDLGKAHTTFSQHDGLYTRDFENGVVLVLPQGVEPRTYSFGVERFTLEGESVKGHVKVSPGQGIILFKERPKLVGNLRIDMGSSTANTVPHWGEVVRQGDGKNILRLKRTPKEREWEHDFILDWVRSLSPGASLSMRVKTPDTNCKILLLAEVDDTKREHEFAVLEISSGGPASGEPRVKPGIFYRMDRADAKLPWISVPVSLKSSESWKTHSFNGRELFEPTKRYAFRRWVLMRIIGDMDIEYVDIRRSEN